MTESQSISLIALFNEQGELLLLKRADDAHCPGLWSLPGGKLEPDESPLAAAKRELLEETGFRCEEWRELGESDHRYADRHLHFHLFSCRCLDAGNMQKETKHAWVPPAELHRYPMPAANNALLPLLDQKIAF